MPCRRIGGEGWSGFACTRGSSQTKPCSCGARGEYLCDYPLKGKKEGQTCDRSICRTHAKLIKKTAEGSIHYCPVHQKMAEKEAREFESAVFDGDISRQVGEDFDEILMGSLEEGEES